MMNIIKNTSYNTSDLDKHLWKIRSYFNSFVDVDTHKYSIDTIIIRFIEFSEEEVHSQNDYMKTSGYETYMFNYITDLDNNKLFKHYYEFYGNFKESLDIPFMDVFKNEIQNHNNNTKNNSHKIYQKDNMFIYITYGEYKHNLDK